MNYTMTGPCDKCPFRNDVVFGLARGRATEIAMSLLRGLDFPCHKTTQYDDEDTTTGENSQHCGGAMIFLEAQNRPNQMMRICERIGMYDRRKLNMDAPIHRTTADFEAGQLELLVPQEAADAH